MSGMKRYLSRRGPLWALATFVLLVTMGFVTSGTSNAANPNAIKQFTASISPTTGAGQVSRTWTETVTNCGPGSPGPCTLNSVIAIGTVQIVVPTSPNSFQTNGITNLSCSLCAPSVGYPNAPGTWTVSYSSGVIQANALQGANKLQPGQAVQISFTAKPETCAAGTDTFTTSASGSLPPPPFTDKFTIAGGQPSVTINGCALASGDPVGVTGEHGTNVTGNDYQGTVNVSFGGTLTCNNTQWQTYQLPDQVNIDPTGSTASGPKSFTFKFDGTGDSSFYLICYSPNDTDTTGTILEPCYPGGGPTATFKNPPCVDQQYRDFTTNKIVIKIRVPAGDPRAH